MENQRKVLALGPSTQVPIQENGAIGRVRPTPTSPLRDSILLSLDSGRFTFTRLAPTPGRTNGTTLTIYVTTCLVETGLFR